MKTFIPILFLLVLLLIFWKVLVEFPVLTIIAIALLWFTLSLFTKRKRPH